MWQISACTQRDCSSARLITTTCIYSAAQKIIQINVAATQWLSTMCPVVSLVRSQVSNLSLSNEIRFSVILTWTSEKKKATTCMCLSTQFVFFCTCSFIHHSHVIKPLQKPTHLMVLSATIFISSAELHASCTVNHSVRTESLKQCVARYYILHSFFSNVCKKNRWMKNKKTQSTTAPLHLCL